MNGIEATLVGHVKVTTWWMWYKQISFQTCLRFRLIQQLQQQEMAKNVKH